MVPTRLPDPFGGLTVALTELRNTQTGLCVTIG
jgi:hypothetical protein